MLRAMQCKLMLGCSPLCDDNCWNGFSEDVVNILVALLSCYFLCPELLNAINKLLFRGGLYSRFQVEFQLVP